MAVPRQNPPNFFIASLFARFVSKNMKRTILIAFFLILSLIYSSLLLNISFVYKKSANVLRDLHFVVSDSICSYIYIFVVEKHHL